MRMANNGKELLEICEKEQISLSEYAIRKEMESKNVSREYLFEQMKVTLDAMKETIIQLKNYDNNIKVMVGGAVLNEECAINLGADAYGPDAMSAVRFAEKFYN